IGHGGLTKYPIGLELIWYPETQTYETSTTYSPRGGGSNAVYCISYTSDIRVNVIGNGIFQGGGGAGGAGGGLLSVGSTHWDLGLAPFMGVFGGGGAPYGGALYTFYGNSGDPVCPTRWVRSTTRFTAARRLGDTGSYGYN